MSVCGLRLLDGRTRRRERSELAGVLSVGEAGIPPSSEGDKER